MGVGKLLCCHACSTPYSGGTPQLGDGVGAPAPLLEHAVHICMSRMHVRLDGDVFSWLMCRLAWRGGVLRWLRHIIGC